MTKKLAVILMNMGGPLKKEDINPFLSNFFMDKNIITAPYFIRKPLAFYISWKRSKGKALKAYKQLGYKSPLLENTKEQAIALEKVLLNCNLTGFDKAKTFVSMRYWHPMAKETIEKVKQYNPDNIILLPLYPQYSTATSKSSIEDWNKTAKINGLDCPTMPICCYPLNDGFITASVNRITKAYKKATKQNPNIKYRVLFSAHGLPEKTINAGDPYQWQCEISAEKIAKEMQIDNLDWQICYQSRVGRLKWIGPSTIEAIKQAAKDNVGIIIYPHAFVSEHVETLVEIEQEYRELAKNLNIPDFIRVETVGTDIEFINGLCDVIKHSLDGSKASICQKQHKKCACKILKDVV